MATVTLKLDIGKHITVSNHTGSTRYASVKDAVAYLVSQHEGSQVRLMVRVYNNAPNASVMREWFHKNPVVGSVNFVLQQ